MDLVGLVRTRWDDPRLRKRCWIALSVFALCVRCALLWYTEGTNDVRGWMRHARLINEQGLGPVYVADWWLNHPPLMAEWAAFVGRVTDHQILPFARLFKLPSLIAELCTALLLFSVYRRRGDGQRSWAAFALYLAAWGNVLICSFHGNTDSMYFALSFAGIYMMQERQAGFWSGLLMAGAMNVKLIPIMIALPLAACARNMRVFVRYALGGCFAAIPFAVAYQGFTPNERDHFISNIFGYKSFPEWWGVEAFVRTLLSATARSLPEVATWIRESRDVYYLQGGKLLLFVSALLALWARFGRRAVPPNAYPLTAAAYAMFLLFAPGWGVQYLGCLLAPFVAFSLRSGFWIAFWCAVQTTLIYTQFMVRWDPASSEHMPYPADLSGVSAVVWSMIAYQAWRALRSVHVKQPEAATRQSLPSPAATHGPAELAGQ